MTQESTTGWDDTQVVPKQNELNCSQDIYFESHIGCSSNTV